MILILNSSFILLAVDVVVFLLFFNYARLFAINRIVSCLLSVIIVISLFISSDKHSVELYSHIIRQVLEAHRKFGRYLLDMLLLVQRIEVLNKVFLELVQRRLNLLLFQSQDIWVLEIGNAHVAD